MAEDMLIRKENLARLGKTPTELAEFLGKSVSYWRDLMRDPKKSFGEKVAREIEQKYPLPRMWLDQSHDDDDPVPVAGVRSAHGLDAPPEAEGLMAQSVSHARRIVDLPRLTWEQLMTADLNQPFELVVDDDALAPEIFKGCIARFESNRAPSPGRPVLVRDRDGRHYLRDYQAGPGDRWQAVPRARGFSPLDSEKDGLVVVAVMRGYDWP